MGNTHLGETAEVLAGPIGACSALICALGGRHLRWSGQRRGFLWLLQSLGGLGTECPAAPGAVEALH